MMANLQRAACWTHPSSWLQQVPGGGRIRVVGQRGVPRLPWGAAWRASSRGGRPAASPSAPSRAARRRSWRCGPRTRPRCARRGPSCTASSSSTSAAGARESQTLPRTGGEVERTPSALCSERVLHSCGLRVDYRNLRMVQHMKFVS